MRQTVLLVVLLALGCSEASVERRDAAAPRSVAVEIFRIGSLEGEDDSFGQVRGVAVSASGSRIAVLDGQQRELRLFDRTGDLIRVAGGPGGGPGEFTFPVALGSLADSFWVADASTRRFSIFDSEGVLVRDARPVSTAGPASLTPSDMLDDGSFLGSPTVRSRDVATGAITSVPFVRMTSEGQVLDTMWQQATSNSSLMIESDRGAIHTQQPLADHLLPEVSGLANRMYKVVADGTGVSLLISTLTDSVVAKSPLGLEVASVSDAVVDRTVDSLVEFLSGSQFGEGYSAAELKEMIRRSLFVPEYRLPIDATLLASNGTLWLRERPENGADSTWWRHFDANGVETRRTRLSTKLVLSAARGSELWGRYTDELGVGYVVAYSLEN